MLRRSPSAASAPRSCDPPAPARCGLPFLAAAGGRDAARPPIVISPLRSREDAEQRQQQLLLPLAVEAAQAEDLPLAPNEMSTLRWFCQRRLRASSSGAGRGRGRGLGGNWRPSRARSSAARSRRRCAGALGERLDVLAVAEHRHHVGQLLDLVHAVRDVEDGQPSSAARPGCASPSRRRAPVSAEVASSRISRRGFRPSALAISTICRRDRGRLLTNARGLMSSQPTRASSSSARRAGRRRSNSPNRLVGMVMPMFSATDRSASATAPGRRRRCRPRWPRPGGEGHRLAFEEQLAGVRLDHAGDDLDQRALAGPVLAQDRVNLAAAQAKLTRSRRATPP